MVERAKQDSSALTRPLLRWAGSKRMLLPRLVDMIPEFSGKYIEPFVGSGALLLALAPADAVVGDTNPEITNLFRCVKDDPIALHRAVQRLAPNEKTYLRLRRRPTVGATPTQRAARLLFLNRFAFNGLFRTNASGDFNVPFSRSRNGTLPTRVHLSAISDRLRHTRIRTGDFERTILEHLNRDDFVYLDPPYAVRNRRIFRQYGPDVFGSSDLERLACVLHTIDGVGARFIVSYADCSEARDVFGDWTITRAFVQRNVSGFVSKRRLAAELLITND